MRFMSEAIWIGVVVSAIGCGSTDEVRRGRSASREAKLSSPREIPEHRRPSRVGDVLIYPCQWRKADDVAAELAPLLYRKYGYEVQIVPDRPNNQLLIYLPPSEEAPAEPQETGSRS